MKTLLHTAALFTIITVIFGTSSFASEVNFKDEAYIDDIPFSTEMVFNEIMNSELVFEEEAYINDIPFNSEKIVEEYTFAKAVSTEFHLTEETYIDDIPFNTYTIANIDSDFNKNDLCVSAK